MRKVKKSDATKKNAAGFTLIEVMVAGSLMIVLCVGLLTIFSVVVQRNRGENLRMQALSVLQKEVEYYRSLQFVPVGTSTELNGGDYPNLRETASSDGRIFYISVKIDNDPSTPEIDSGSTSDATTKYKQISIDARPKIAESGWLSNLKTNVTIRRVKSN